MVRTGVVVIGAGQAGLSAAAGLRRAGLEPGRDFVVLDAEDGPGGAWRHRWPSLLMRTVNGIHDLAGVRSGFDAPDADPDRPAREAVPEYFAGIERYWDLRVVRPVRVHTVRDSDRPARDGDDPAHDSGVPARGGDPARSGDGPARDGDGPVRQAHDGGYRAGPLDVVTDHGTWRADEIINATGTWTRPFVPAYPGAASFRGRSLHARDYPGAAALAGRRVVVVGGGITAVQLLLEIAPHAAATTWVTRREPVWHEGTFDAERGRAAVAQVEERVRAGLPPRSVVGVTGLGLTPAVRAGLASGVLDRREMFTRITPDGVAWDDGTVEPADVILWATGWRAALGHLRPLRLRAPGGGILLGPPQDTTVVGDPRVHLVGYGPSASTIGADRAGRAAARAALDRLRGVPAERAA
ncbi:NAD(P)-binding Rossmann-like domain-containing protein [Pseudonocardia ammonioxydans]|uniref:NAD(P)-binding Rossmann-like domain-containing protein n=1 Tax=Pseudonocardia ammonioxydans TaxID=260086 RepID=A0A1I5BX74_PSUAM|nr:NAD(P)-binding domain-containing protein [Pseudonocardia ammonioxydans]SFN79284.1 NAD(P)-binding Rossmann-like domain-containing protein [Pseudonocardia ammonioxydans]